MADSGNDAAGRRPRNYYTDYTKKNKYGNSNNRAGKGGAGGQYGANKHGNKSKFSSTPNIAFGDRGFLITSIDEVKSYLEMRNILEDYFNQLYQDKTQPALASGEQANELSVEDELESELKQLRSTRPFKQVKTQCRRTLFINIVKDFKHVDPVLVVDKFFDDLAEKRQIRSSNTYKVLPIMDTFRNSLACVKESVGNILQNILNDDSENVKYFIEFETRGNYKLSSEDKQKWVEAVANKISELRPTWKVDRLNSDYMIVLTALKDVCCITFLKQYFKRSKYNVIEFCKDFVPSTTDSSNALEETPKIEAGDDSKEVEEEEEEDNK